MALFVNKVVFKDTIEAKQILLHKYLTNQVYLLLPNDHKNLEIETLLGDGENKKDEEGQALINEYSKYEELKNARNLEMDKIQNNFIEESIDEINKNLKFMLKSKEINNLLIDIYKKNIFGFTRINKEFVTKFEDYICSRHTNDKQTYGNSLRYYKNMLENKSNMVYYETMKENIIEKIREWNAKQYENAKIAMEENKELKEE